MKLRYTPAKNTVLVGGWKKVPKDAVDLRALRRALTVPNPHYFQRLHNGMDVTGILSERLLYRETNTQIWVPRHTPLPLLPGVAPLPELRLSEAQRNPKEYPLVSGLRPRAGVQEGAIRTLLDPRGDKLLALACGMGKTCCALHAAALGKRAPLLVVVHTQALFDQWKKEITRWLGVADEDIAHVQGDRANWPQKAVGVAMLQTLLRRRYSPAFYKHWNLVVFDEVHRTGAELFSRVLPQFPGERWGLSATMERPDGMHAAYGPHFGPVCYRALDQPLKPSVYFLSTGLSTDTVKFRVYNGRVNMPQLYTALSTNEGRNKLLLAWLDRAVGDGRTILVLGERVDQLYALCMACTASSKGVYVGTLKKAERAEALQKQVVFATQHIAKEGLDKPELDTLFVLVTFGGKGRFQQSAGRILREHPGKKPPKVLIFEDDIGILKALGRQMRASARDLGFEVFDRSASPPAYRRTG